MRKSPTPKESRKPKTRKDTTIAAYNELTSPACNCPHAKQGRHTTDCPTYDIWESDEYEFDMSDALIDIQSDDDPYMATLAALAASDENPEPISADGKPGYVILSDGSIVEHGGHLTPPDDAPGISVTPSNWTYAADGWYSGGLYQCEHDRQAYTLTDGTVVYASAWTDTPALRPWEPDLACYADPAWIPETAAYHIGWPDYGIPKPRVQDVIFMLEHLLTTAREMFRVEVGCMGGHGRTGTMLAILDILSTKGTSSPLGAKNAITRVRNTYCDRAIEGVMQEWYVRAAHAVIFGNPIPRKPKVAKPKVTIINAGTQTTDGKGTYLADASGRMTWHRSELEIPGGSVRGDILVLPNGERFLIIDERPDAIGPKKLVKEDSQEAGEWLAKWTAEREQIKDNLAKAQELAAQERARRTQTAAGIAAHAPVNVTDGVKMVVRIDKDGPRLVPVDSHPATNRNAPGVGPKPTEDTTAGASVPTVEATYRDRLTGELKTVTLPSNSTEATE